MPRQNLVRRRPAISGKPADGLDRGTLNTLCEDFQVLAHPVRLQILDILTRSEDAVCVSELQDRLPVQQPTVSHHLRLLRQAGLVSSEKRGLWVYCSVNREVAAALRNRILAGLEPFGRPPA